MISPATIWLDLRLNIKWLSANVEINEKINWKFNRKLSSFSKERQPHHGKFNYFPYFFAKHR